MDAVEKDYFVYSWKRHSQIPSLKKKKNQNEDLEKLEDEYLAKN